jgi:hypothetical protein
MTAALVDWDSTQWGVAGHNIHLGSSVDDGKHDDGVSDQ